MGREHWEEITLEECCKINPRHNGIDDDLPVTFVTMSDLSENSAEFQSQKLRKYSEVKTGFTHFAENDVLFAKITPCMENGKAAIATNLSNKIGCGTTELHVIRPLGGISSTLIYNFVHQKSFREAAKEKFTGTAGQQRAPVTFLSEYPFPLPPLAEQHRIVEKLDALLPKVKSAKTRLEKIPRILKKFRQSVLAAACSGRLTEDWNENGNYMERGQKKLSQFERVEIYTGPFGSAVHKEDYIQGGIPLINPMHINDGRIYPSLSTTVSKKKAQELNRYYLEVGDVIIARRGEMGRAALVTKNEEGMLCGTGSMFIRNKNKNLQSEFLSLSLRSPITVEFLNGLSVGTTMVNINQGIIGDLEILSCSISEQNEIIRRISTLFKLADSLEAKYKKAMAAVEKIEQAILAKAFRGDLAAQDPADEPAGELLKRIQKEKETTGAGKSKRKTLKND